MTTTEKLQRIRARCVELLEIASKRTPGKWKHNKGRRMQISVDSLHEDAVIYGDEFELGDCDADFIASCAGAAEAGWRATIAAIDGLLPITTLGGGRSEGNFMAQDAVKAIIAAWPEGLL